MATTTTVHGGDRLGTMHAGINKAGRHASSHARFSSGGALPTGPLATKRKPFRGLASRFC
jgi:hypothetical protein